MSTRLCLAGSSFASSLHGGAKLRALALLVCLLVAIAAGFVAWSVRPITLTAEAPASGPMFELRPGAGLRDATRAAQAASGVSAVGLELLARVTNRAGQLKPGRYRIDSGMSPQSLLERMVRGDSVLAQITIVEGWTAAQMRAAIDVQTDLKHDTAGLDDKTLLSKLGLEATDIEGRFFPDTYKFAPGSSDLVVYRQALDAMNRALESAWNARSPGLPFTDAYQALILASIVEKETGQASERPAIAAVFVNRLKRGMLLQTDPSVIYGLGERFDGDLRKRDLNTDTPYNTYTRAGLPPTPIALPGRQALIAATHPPASDALYFVARGDGTSQFSATLEDHNRAVNRYQRGR